MSVKPPVFDIAVIGAGINGAGIARDATLRGYKTFICDKGDLGSETSLYSSKLIHGGLRYLEFYEFNMVRKSLKERDILMNMAAHLVQEQRFVIPHTPNHRPKWLIKTGLYLYDNLYISSKIRKSEAIKLNPYTFKDHLSEGFEYSDCTTDDHRLVISNLMDAAIRGCMVMPYNACTKAEVKDGLWHVHLKDMSGQNKLITAKTLVNATGPWVESFIKQEMKLQNNKKLRLVKGSHIITHKLYEENKAYTLQDAKGRIVFTIPYQKRFTLIGTTEEAFEGNPSQAKISPAEQKYLLEMVNSYFSKEITAEDIVKTFSGVRPLIENTQADARSNSRDYSLETLHLNNCGLVNVWGGKLTTYRQLAHEAIMNLIPFIGIDSQDTSHKPLMSSANPKNLSRGLVNQYPWLPEDIAKRYAYTYGENSLIILKDCNAMRDLGNHFGEGLYEVEVRYLINYEWATSADSVLWRRTKMGLNLSDEEIDIFNDAFTYIYQEIRDGFLEKTEKPEKVDPAEGLTNKQQEDIKHTIQTTIESIEGTEPPTVPAASKA